MEKFKKDVSVVQSEEFMNMVSSFFSGNSLFGKGEHKDKNVDDGTVRGLILSGHYYFIGEHVYKGDGIGSNGKIIATASRRRLKPEDIIMITSDTDEIDSRNFTGLAFTETQLFVFSHGSIDYIIDYAEMENIDFDGSDVYITVTEGETVCIDCEAMASDSDEDQVESYAEESYNLLMDIKERVENA